MTEKRLTNLKILLAEDEPFMRAVLEKTLVSEGAWVAACADGSDALATAQSALVVDIVLLDFMMPAIHGLYLLKKIRTAKAGVRYDIPVGILTGASDQKIVSLSMMLDCDAFLVKPVSKAQLIERVERLRNRMGRKLPAPESYNHLLVGDPHDVDTIPDPSALPSSETVGAQQVRKTVNTLTVGMVLAENLLSSEDSLIVPAKTVITDALLILLRDLDNVTPLKPVAVVA